MAERVDDLKDLERQVLAVLTGEGESGPDVPQGAVVIAGELAPSQVMALDQQAAQVATAPAVVGQGNHGGILSGKLTIFRVYRKVFRPYITGQASSDCRMPAPSNPTTHCIPRRFS